MQLSKGSLIRLNNMNLPEIAGSMFNNELR
jgi:hypothetical protein